MPKYNFKFGQYWLSEFGAVSSEEPTVEIAQRDISFISIPGKDGDDCIDNKRYSNVEFKRKIAFVGNKDIKAQEKELNLINNYAYLQGYQDFEDNNHPGLVTEAALKNFNAVQRKLRTLHTAELAFTRKPFWYLKTGLEEMPLDFSQLTGDGIELNNPYPAPAKPLIRFFMTFSGTSETTTCRIHYSFTSDVDGMPVTKTYSKSSIKITATHNIVEVDLENQRTTVRNESGEIYSFVDAPVPEPLVEGKSIMKVLTVSKINAVSIIPRWRCL